MDFQVIRYNIKVRLMDFLKVTQRDLVTASADFFLSFNMSGLLFTILVAMVSTRRLIGIGILRSQVCVSRSRSCFNNFI